MEMRPCLKSLVSDSGQSQIQMYTCDVCVYNISGTYATPADPFLNPSTPLPPSHLYTILSFLALSFFMSLFFCLSLFGNSIQIIKCCSSKVICQSNSSSDVISSSSLNHRTVVMVLEKVAGMEMRLFVSSGVMQAMVAGMEMRPCFSYLVPELEAT